MAGHVGPLLERTGPLQPPLRDPRDGAARLDGNALHAGLRLEHQLPVALQPAHGVQRRTPLRHELDARARQVDRPRELHAAAARVERQRHPPVGRGRPHLPRHLLRRAAAPQRLPHDSLRQGSLRSHRHPGRRPAPLRLRGQHRRPRRRRSGQLSGRAELRQPHRRRPAVALRNAGARKILGHGDLSFGGAHARSAPRARQGPPLRPALLPLHGALRRPRPRRPRRPLLRQIQGAGAERPRGGLRGAGRGNGQEPGRPARLARTQRRAAEHHHPLHERQRRSGGRGDARRRAPHAERPAQQRQGVGLRRGHPRTDARLLAGRHARRRAMRRLPAHRGLLPHHPRDGGHPPLPDRAAD